MEKVNMIDSLIENIKTDKGLLEEAELQIASAKETKRRISSRLKEYREDIGVLSKYLDDTQKSKLEALDLYPEQSTSRSRMNTVAEIALELLIKAKDYTLSNEAWYQGYIKTHPEEKEMLSYSEFNIKCRGLFNTMKVLRTKGKNPKSSKGDMISLNGKPIKDIILNESPKSNSNSKPSKDDTGK